jgi:hypothetical protein
MHASAPKLLEAPNVWELINKARSQQQLTALHARAIRQSDCELLALALGFNDLGVIYFYAVVWLELIAPDPSQFTGINAVAAEKTVQMPGRGVPRPACVA